MFTYWLHIAQFVQYLFENVEFDDVAYFLCNIEHMQRSCDLLFIVYLIIY